MHYILLFSIVDDLCKMAPREQIQYIRGLNDQQHMLYDYLKGVWLPALYKEELDVVPVLEQDDYMQSVEELLVRLNLHGVDSTEGIFSSVYLTNTSYLAVDTLLLVVMESKTME